MVAWTEMVISYSQQGPVVEAVAKTFDGHHPCDLCKQIARSKRSEKKAEYKFEWGKLKFPYTSWALVFTHPGATRVIVRPDDLPEMLTHAPPVPPPRPFIG